VCGTHGQSSLELAQREAKARSAAAPLIIKSILDATHMMGDSLNFNCGIVRVVTARDPEYFDLIMTKQKLISVLMVGFIRFSEIISKHQ